MRFWYRATRIALRLRAYGLYFYARDRFWQAYDPSEPRA